MLSFLKKHTFISFFLLLACFSFCYGQQYSRLENEIRIGELKGRTDVRDLKILTSAGLVPVTGEGNGKPFSIVSLSSQQIILKFYPTKITTPGAPKYLSFKFYDTERALITGLILDEIDVAVLESERSATEVKKSNPHFLPLPIPMEANKVKLVLFNNQSQFLSDKDVRTAISYGIDHDYIINKVILGGKASIARGPFDENSPSYNPGMPTYKYNPRIALQMLREEGWLENNEDGICEKNGQAFTIDLFYQKGLRLDEQISRVIKINLAKIGVDIKPKPLEKSKINDNLVSGKFDAVLIDFTFEDGIQSIESFFSKGGEQNYAGYHNSTLEKYIRFYNSSKNSDRKLTLLKSMQSVLNRDQPAAFLYFKWLTHYLVNVQKFENFRYTEGPNRGKMRPYDEWIFKE